MRRGPGKIGPEKIGPDALPLEPGWGLHWPGKPDDRALAETPPAGTLVPVGEPGDAGGHTFIEGDNLDALKLLAATHTGAFRAIYIDPPYNTGTGLVYRDDFRARVGRGGATDSTDRSSRRHMRWLGFLYPRLLLARALLREDGAIFVSIDDGGVAPLRMLLDEVFGEERHLGTFVWLTKQAPRGVPPRTRLIPNHEYVLAYTRGEGFAFRGDDRDDDGFANPDGDPRGPWRSESMKATGKQDNHFDIVDPATGLAYPGNWAFSQASIAEMIRDGRVIFPPKPGGVPRQKKLLGSYRNATKAIVTHLGWHSTERATASLIRRFDGEKVFDFPKPVELLVRLLGQATGPDDQVLDFFAGSGTTAEAVLRLNQADGGRRRYTLVQLPEPTGRPDLPTLADVARERIRRVEGELGIPPGAGGFRELRIG